MQKEFHDSQHLDFGFSQTDLYERWGYSSNKKLFMRHYPNKYNFYSAHQIPCHHQTPRHSLLS